jgi:hypothetical protein
VPARSNAISTANQSAIEPPTHMAQQQCSTTLVKQPDREGSQNGRQGNRAIR